MRKDEAELLVVAERKKKAGAGRERSSTSSATMACDGAAAAARASGGREREWRSANGSGGNDGRGRALLVADQGASGLPHARHAAARLCRRATTAPRGRSRAGTAQALARGRG